MSGSRRAGAGRLAAPAAQRGVVLFIALIALLALTLSGLAFMRSVDASGMIAGNLAFSRASVSISDLGMEQARARVTTIAALTCAGKNCLWKDQGGQPQTNGYWARWQNNFDYRSTDWSQAFQVDTTALPAIQRDAVNGYEIRYIIHRMCERAWTSDTDPDDGNPVTSNCVFDTVAFGLAGTKGSLDYGNNLSQAAQDSSTPFYRVTIRVRGPRNSISYVQAWMI